MSRLNRSETEIIEEVLQYCTVLDGEDWPFYYKIQEKCNMAGESAKRMVEMLQQAKMLEMRHVGKNSKKFRTTQEGIDYLNKLHPVNEMLHTIRGTND